MKKIMYILIGLLVASLVYITFLSDIPDVYIPDTVVSKNQDNQTNPDNEGIVDVYNPDEVVSENLLDGYRVAKEDSKIVGVEIGKPNPMFFKKDIPVEKDYSISKTPTVGVSKTPDNQIKQQETSIQEITRPEITSPEIAGPEISSPIVPTKPAIVVEANNDEMKEILENLDKEVVKQTFKPIEIRDFMKSFNKEPNKKDSIYQVIELSYSCDKCSELFLLPLDTKNITIPKVYGEKGTENTKYPVYTGMDIVLKENEGFKVYNKSEGKVKSIEIDKTKGCGIVTVIQGNDEVIYEHLSFISNELEVDKVVKEGQVIGEVKANGSPKGLNYNIKVDMGGYRVNSNVFVVTEEQVEETTQEVIVNGR